MTFSMYDSRPQYAVILLYVTFLGESILCTHSKVEYDWKVGAWAGRRKVKDTWGLVVLKGGKLGDAVVGMEELWERIIVS